MNIAPIPLKLCRCVDNSIGYRLLAWINTILLSCEENVFLTQPKITKKWKFPWKTKSQQLAVVRFWNFAATQWWCRMRCCTNFKSVVYVVSLQMDQNRFCCCYLQNVVVLLLCSISEQPEGALRHTSKPQKAAAQCFQMVHVVAWLDSGVMMNYDC